MNKQDYIKAIEKLNEEQIEFYYSEEYRKFRNRKIKKIKKIRRKTRSIAKKIYYHLFRINKQSQKNDELNISQNIMMNENFKKQIDELDKKRKVVYTCVLGQYDKMYSPLIITDNTDYIVYTDNDELIDEIDYWKIRPIPESIKKICNNNPILINRYFKMHPNKFFEDYDYALYIDGNIRVISDITELFTKINPKTGIALHKHSKRNNVYEEAKRCIEIKRGNIEKIKKQIKKYEEEKFPDDFGLFEATIMAVDLLNKNSEKFLHLWWDELIKSETLRDQIVLPYVLWKNNYKYEDIGILGNEVSHNPKFKRLNHI